jgi:hypothetical protein
LLKNLNIEIMDLDERPIMDAGKVITLKSVCTSALLFQDPSSPPISGDQKFLRWELAKRIHGEKDHVDLSAEEVSLLKEAVNRIYAPLIYGRLCEAIDPKEKK